MPADVRTRAAFDVYRGPHGPARAPRSWKHDSDCDRMTVADGLDRLVDGPGADPAAPATLARMSADALPAAPRLWTVLEKDVLHAPVHCAFGTERAAKEVKHTNLTGGGKAFGGGEIIVTATGALIVNGLSGRYRIRSAAELSDVALAFKNAG